MEGKFPGSSRTLLKLLGWRFKMSSVDPFILFFVILRLELKGSNVEVNPRSQIITRQRQIMYGVQLLFQLL